MLSLAAALLAASVGAAPWDIAPPPRGQWCVDQTGTLSLETLAALDDVAREVDAAGVGQLGVLVTETTSGVTPRTFATHVFNAWGVGHAGRDDGILLFVATKDRKAEIILGDGCGVTSAQTDVVMRNDVVANMKRGDLPGALIHAAQSLARLLRTANAPAGTTSVADNVGLGPNAYAVAPTQPVDEPLMAYVRGEKAFPERSPRSWVVDLSEKLDARQRAALDVAASDVYADGKGRLFFLVADTSARWPSLEGLARRLRDRVDHHSSTPVAVVAANAARGEVKVLLPAERVPGEWERLKVLEAEAIASARLGTDLVRALTGAAGFATEALRTGVPPKPMGQALEDGFRRHRGAVTVTFGAFLLGGVWALRRWLRRRPRDCEACGRPRQLLGEAEDDAHLSAGQKAEERVGSVDYDVWWCGSCRDALVLDYSSWFSSHSRCPRCRNRTRSSRTTTVQRATEYSGGLERIDESCAHCSYTNSYTRTTARLQRTKTSSSSWSSSSWSSSSSPSSPSSFGGGRSSGGGSSGSW
ncbi:MAG: TPM domain-containing protein [Myxococcota bacterium]